MSAAIPISLPGLALLGAAGFPVSRFGAEQFSNANAIAAGRITQLASMRQK